MPSNKEITKEIEALSEKLGVPVNTEGLNNGQLANLASDLRAKARDAELETQADSKEPAEKEPAEKEPAEKEPAEKEPAVATKKTGHSVAKGKAITTKRGILADGETIKAEDLPGGADRLNELVKSRHVVKH